MPSSFSANLLLELMSDGENEGLWGDITNENLEILGRAAGGVGGIALAGTSHTLTVAQGALSEGQYSTLVLGGSPTGTNTITIQPNTVTRTYLVQNSSGQDAIFTQGSGGNVTVPNGGTSIVFCSGTGASSSVTDTTADFLRGVNNLSEIDDAATALTNLGLTATAAELNKLDGITASTAELNKLDGLTATTAELNKLDGATVTTAELNILDGLTATTAELNKLDGFTGVAADLNYAKDLRATGVTTTEFDKLDGLTASTADLNTASTHYVPQGGIIMWSGTIANIPSGWALCDGTNGTPDLTGRFVVHADADSGGTYAPGDTGGADNVTLTEAQMPSHTHSVSGSTNTTGAHDHTPLNGNGFLTNTTSGSESTFNYGSGSAVFTGVVTRTSSAGNHSHTVTGTAASTGGDESHENRPPYLALAYIMKL